MYGKNYLAGMLRINKARAYQPEFCLFTINKQKKYLIMVLIGQLDSPGFLIKGCR
jgi:hypothetical protein